MYCFVVAFVGLVTRGIRTGAGREGAEARSQHILLRYTSYASNCSSGRFCTQVPRAAGLDAFSYWHCLVCFVA